MRIEAKLRIMITQLLVVLWYFGLYAFIPTFQQPRTMVPGCYSLLDPTAAYQMRQPAVFSTIAITPSLCSIVDMHAPAPCGLTVAMQAP